MKKAFAILFVVSLAGCTQVNEKEFNESNEGFINASAQELILNYQVTSNNARPHS
ncbi:hypothetical protein GF352_02070 [archaeon]|nr:hypothetical protein [archaeon]